MNIHELYAKYGDAEPFSPEWELLSKALDKEVVRLQGGPRPILVGKERLYASSWRQRSEANLPVTSDDRPRSRHYGK